MPVYRALIFATCYVVLLCGTAFPQIIESIPPPVNPSLERPLSAPAALDTNRAPSNLDNFEPWWHQALTSQLAENSQPLDVTVETLIAGAFEYSHQIRSFSDLPLIREQTIGEATGRFDWRVFADSGYSQISDPVGNFLTTGGANRFRESDWQTNAGLRRQNPYGGQFEISQQLGLTDNNSTFFIPPNQGTSRMTLSYNHPLMRGRGLAYNTSQIYLSMLDTAAANDEFSRQLQAHILEVARAYWALYVERATLLQRVKLVQQSEELYQLLEMRSNLDVGSAQILRAKSAVAQRRSDLARSRAAIRNAESRIVSLVNDPFLEQAGGLEMLPVAKPDVSFAFVDMSDSKVSAIENRPEITQARTQIQAAAQRVDVACNELMPYLNVVLETYVAGLKGHSDIGQAWTSQFSEGQPSYSAGLVFEYPIHNHTARARYTRRKLEVRQLQSQLRATIETLMLEVEVAVREVQTSYAELESKHLAMEANQAEVIALRQRWEILVGNDPSAALYLDSLLAAQVRLALSEKELADAMATYNLSLVNLSRARGTLLQDQQVETLRLCANCLPQISVGQREYEGSFFGLDSQPTTDSPAATIESPSLPY